VGKPLHAPLEGRHSARRGTYRVIYRIDDVERQVLVLGVFARSDAYRSP
jgi:mRNA-degrading endonuclease RelE of RelBE toxin-antitoxin system